MPTIAEQLQQIATIKANIKAAIEAKGETVGSDAFATYPTHIGNISGGGGGSDMDDFIKNVLTSLTIPSGVTKVRDNLCYQQTALTSVTIPSGVTSVGVAAFSGCSGLTSITLPSSVTSIGNNAFAGCSKMVSISIPAGLTSVGSSAFSTCGKLEQITIPNGVTSILAQTFYSCTGLKTIDLGSGITSIAANVFTNNFAVDTLICRATSAPTVQASSFGTSAGNYIGRTATGTKKLYVPQGCSSAYNTSYWASVLLDASKCGFTIAELDANGNIPT